MHPLIGLVQLLGIGFVLSLGSLILYTMWGLSHPRRQSYAWAVSRGLPGDPGELDLPVSFEEHTIKASKGKLTLWTIAGNNPAAPRIIMTHGWGSSKLGGLKRIPALLEHASQIIIWDLPGHGDSSGITRLGATEHNDLAYILESFESDQPPVLYGWSMGSGVSLAFAKVFHAEHQIAGIICESPYIHPITPARNVIRLRGVPHRLNLKPSILLLGTLFGVGPTWCGFGRDQIAKDLNLPILILHGDADPVCPIADAQRIAASAPNAQLVRIAGGGHNNLWTDDLYRQQMSDAIDSFMHGLST